MQLFGCTIVYVDGQSKGNRKQLSDSGDKTDHFGGRDAAVCVSDNFASGGIDYDGQDTISRALRELMEGCGWEESPHIKNYKMLKVWF